MANDELRSFFSPFMDENLLPRKSEHIGKMQRDVSEEEERKIFFFFNFYY
jgi:hypothetical protein